MSIKGTRALGLDETGGATNHGRGPTDTTYINDAVNNEDTTDPNHRKNSRARCPPKINDEKKKAYYQTFMTQFSNLILIATFTGGVQASILSFIHDLISINKGLKPFPEEMGAFPKYNLYSLGLILGLLAVALNLSVAVVAAANAALACHCSLLPNDPEMNVKARMIFCMSVQFVAATLAGISLVLLSLNFDLIFACVSGLLFFSGVLISIYHILMLFGEGWLERLKDTKLHGLSLVLATVAFGFDVTVPTRTSWFTITNYGMTVVYHLLAVSLSAEAGPSVAKTVQEEDAGTRGEDKQSGEDKKKQRNLKAIIGALILTVFWVTSVIVTSTFKGQGTRSERAWIALVICTVGSVEAFVLFIIAVHGIWRW